MSIIQKPIIKLLKVLFNKCEPYNEEPTKKRQKSPFNNCKSVEPHSILLTVSIVQI